MKRFFLLTAITFGFFLLEFVFYHLFGRWFKPNFIILLVIFFNVFFETKYSLFVAIVGGILKDSFSTIGFGTYTFSFIVCSYLVTLIRKYFYQVESGYLRIVVVVVLCFVNSLIVGAVSFSSGFFRLEEIAMYVLLPEALATIVVAVYTFQKLRLCVLKLSV